jgi:hypothetical protein
MASIHLEPSELGWLAGMWDGEGTCGIHFRLNKGNPRYFPFARLGNTHKPTTERFLELVRQLGCYGAELYPASPATVRNKPSWQVSIHKVDDIICFGKAIIPFSITKHEQWSVVLQFCESRSWDLGKHGGRGVLSMYTPYELELFERSKLLNRRGPSE